MKTFSTWSARTAWGAAFALLIGASQASSAEEDGPPSGIPLPPLPVASASVATGPVPFVTIPEELKDPAFEKFVDFKLLTAAYVSQDATGIMDVALQVREGERILLRQHSALRVGQMIDIALKIAADKHDVATLERIAKFAEITNDNALGDRVRLSKQLASKPRAVAAEPPPPGPKMSSEETVIAQAMLTRMQRARTSGDVAELKSLQAELKGLNKTGESLIAFIEKQVSEAIEATGTEEGTGETAGLLTKLSATSRGGACIGPFLDGAISADAKSATIRLGGSTYYYDTSNNHIIFPNDYPSWGWVPLTSYYGLKGRFGNLFINLSTLKATDGNWYGIYPANPDYVIKTTMNPTTKQYSNSWVGLKDIASLTFLNITNPSSGLAVDPNAMNLVASGAGNIVVHLPPNLVASGAGNLVASGAGNLVASGAGNLVASGAGNLVYGPVINGTLIDVNGLKKAASSGTIIASDNVIQIGKAGYSLQLRGSLSISGVPSRSSTQWANATKY